MLKRRANQGEWHQDGRELLGPGGETKGIAWVRSTPSYEVVYPFSLLRRGRQCD